MKRPRYSLRAMLFAVAIIAVGLWYLRYLSQRGWTTDKLDKLIKAEFDPTWNWSQFETWVRKHGLEPAQYHSGAKEKRGIIVYERDGANFGLFQGRGSIQTIFNQDQNGQFSMHEIHKIRED